ncbi:MAG: hypothetical protein FJX35_27605 [Alphaproteobacteria bacterium]|nr:hypothetical protein [Alphaproteobacteria bacterium]
MIIRPEMAADWSAIDEVNRLASGGSDEGELVRRLRQDGLACASLVAIDNADLVGHIMLS